MVSILNNAPTGAPLITGTLEQGGTLSVDMSGVSDADGIDTSIAPIYRWLRDGNNRTTAETLLLEQGDVDTQYTVEVTYTDLLSHVETVTSDATTPIANVNDPASGYLIVIFRPTPPVGESSPFEGQTLSVNTSQIIDPDGVTYDGTIDFFRDGETINWSPPVLYRLLQSDVGSIFTASYTYVDGFGVTETVFSRAIDTQAVQNVNNAPTGQIFILGEALIGETLEADSTGVSDLDGTAAVTDLSYQWLRDDEIITGATASTYVIAEADTGAALSVRMSFTDDFGALETVVSDQTDTVTSLVGIIVTGTPDPDPLEGTSREDTITGLAGDDTLTGGRGNDTLDGGTGTDTAVFAGDQTGFSIVLSKDGTTITDRGPGGTGTDNISSIEFLDFDIEDPVFEGEPMHLDLFDDAAQLDADVFALVTELYIAYFNRAPDAVGLFYWASEAVRGYELPQMAKSFFVQDETLATYSDMLDDDGNLVDTESFIIAVYNNVLGRTPDQIGYDYWFDELENNPDIDPPIFILAILNGAKFPSDPTELTAQDQIYLSTKVDIGGYYSAIKGLSNVEWAKEVMDLFDSSDPSIELAVELADDYYDAAENPNTGEFIMSLVGVLDDPFAMG
jgi:Ca2+-binding RTX toxin-like protein